MTVSLLHGTDTEQLVSELWAIESVAQVSLTWESPKELRVAVTLDADNWSLRESVIAAIDDFHRAHVETLSVDFDLFDVARPHREHQHI